jgi:hypothetical protein
MPDSVAIPPAQTFPSQDGGREEAARRISLELLHSVKELTERHFPEGTVEIEIEADPEVAFYQFFVFSVTASGTAERIVDRECLWHREIHRLAPDDFDAFRLSVRSIQ